MHCRAHANSRYQTMFFRMKRGQRVQLLTMITQLSAIVDQTGNRQTRNWTYAQTSCSTLKSTKTASTVGTLTNRTRQTLKDSSIPTATH